MSTEPPVTPADPQEPHPLDLIREQAMRTTPAQVRSELNDLSAQQIALAQDSGWFAAAEETFRRVIGMERKSQLEMRVALGEAGRKYERYTKGLADMTLLGSV